MDDPRKLLSRLSEQECNVLKLRCEGLVYKTIGKRMNLSKSAVTQNMDRVLVKLGLDNLSRTEQTKAIFQIYCPLLHNVEEPPELEEKNKQPGPIPTHVEGMVNEDKSAKNVGPVSEQKPPSRSDTKKGGRWYKILGLLVFVVVLGICTGAVVVAYILRSTLETNPFSSHPTPEVQISSPTITETEVQYPTKESASQTPVIILGDTIAPSHTPTTQLTATPTLSPRPKPVTLFSDNFDEGLSSAWAVNYGSPVVVNGKLTTDQDTWLSVGEDLWTDYSVEFDSSGRDCWFSAGWNALGVRAKGTDHMIAFKWANCETEWDVVNAGKWSKVPNSYYSYGTFGDMRIVITAKGDFFAVDVNGERISSFVNSNYSQGYVAIKLGKNLMIDNFKITSINE